MSEDNQGVFITTFPMTRYQVRPATDRDAEHVAAVHATSLQAAYAGAVPPSPQDLPMAKRVAFWRDAIEYGEPFVQVATDESGIVGFVGYDRSRDPKSKATTGEIWALFVLPGHFDKGVGLALWDAAREGLLEEGCTDVTAWIALLNDRAMRFAELAGFKRELASARTAVHGSVKLEEIRVRRTLN